jgi:hypothetical protein
LKRVSMRDPREPKSPPHEGGGCSPFAYLLLFAYLVIDVLLPVNMGF